MPNSCRFQNAAAQTAISILIAAGYAALASDSLASDPYLTSWFTVNSGTYAEIYRTDAEKLSGRTETTWSNGAQSQSQPAFSGVQMICSSSNWVYIYSTGLGSQVMGPWFLDPQRRRVFPNLPTDQHYVFAIPRHPVPQTTNRFNPLGEIGLSVDGIRLFDANDAFSYSASNGRDAEPPAGIGQGDGIWNRDAWVNEGITFDASFGHQQNWGRYHYHAQPIALRYILGDHVDFDSTTKNYSESKTPPARHSPIIGWLHDGYPLYGPYGYSDPKNPASGVRRMTSGYVLRDGKNGSDNLAAAGRHDLPAWEAREHNRPSVALNSSQYGPAVSQLYPLGHYIEDYAYLGDLGKTPGKDFDLDELNGRWCVTPEFPQGTYAYFTTIDADGKPVYPYNMGRRYHGNPTGCLIVAVGEPVVTNFVAQPAPPEKATAKVKTVIWTPDGYQPK